MSQKLDLMLLSDEGKARKKVESSTKGMKCDLPTMKPMLLNTGNLKVIKLLH